jgi:hypothetical protein
VFECVCGSRLRDETEGGKVASFKVIAGDFGQGSGDVHVGRPYRVSAQGIDMPKPGHSFHTEHIGLAQIASLEVATEESLKKMAGSVGWGLAGGLALGPIGALAGILAGGRKTEITFLCEFTDGRKFLGSSNTETFTALQAAMFAAPVKSKESISRGGCAVVVLALVVLVGVIIFLVEDNPPKPVANPTDGLNRPALELVTNLVEGDINAALVQSKNSVLWPKTEDLMAFLKLNWITTAKQYEAAYDENEIAADNDYKGQKILVTGTVVSIDKDFTESAYVTLRGSGLMGVHAGLSEAGMHGGASFTRGQKVNLVCTGSERIITVATLNACESLDDYLKRLSPPIETSVAQFLRDGKSLGNVYVKPVVTMYVIGSHLPPDSPCLKGNLDSCTSDFAALARDKIAAPAIRDEVSRLTASLSSK